MVKNQGGHMKKTIFSIIFLSFIALTSHAKTSKELLLHCEVTYLVLNSKNYYVPPHYRVSEYVTNQESIKILKVSGDDCDVFKSAFGIELKSGQIINTAQNLPGRAIFTGYNHQREGKVTTEKIKQSFKYQLKNDELPLFPLVHQEYASILNINKEANVEKLYGIKSVQNLSDDEKLKLVYLINQAIQYGLDTSFYKTNSFLELLASLEFKSINKMKDYNLALLIVIKNLSKTNFALYNQYVLRNLIHSANKTLNITDGNKYKSKLEVLKLNPILFDFSIISDMQKAPELNETQIEEYLTYALEFSKKLKEVDRLPEVRKLLKQYKDSSHQIYKHSNHSPTNYLGPDYVVTDHALSLTKLIEKI